LTLKDYALAYHRLMVWLKRHHPEVVAEFRRYKQMNNAEKHQLALQRHRYMEEMDSRPKDFTEEMIA
jgi:hypothetical protein